MIDFYKKSCPLYSRYDANNNEGQTKLGISFFVLIVVCICPVFLHELRFITLNTNV
jgi:hypothetical protein